MLKDVHAFDSKIIHFSSQIEGTPLKKNNPPPSCVATDVAKAIHLFA